MSCEVPFSVKCEVTGIEHKVVFGTQNLEEFHSYLRTLIQRLNAEKVNIAIDCEGWVLGTKKGSLGLIQMAECFTPDVLEKDPIFPMSINLKPGFLILNTKKEPISDETKMLLSRVFQTQNINIFTFDFTADFSAMMEAGIRIWTNKAIDSQLDCECKPMQYIMNTKVESLSEVVSKADNCIEFEKVLSALERKAKVDFNELYCDCREIEDPFFSLLNENQWKYASSEIALTAIAFVSRIRETKIEDLKKWSKCKSDTFQKICKQYGPLAPTLKRQFTFIPRNLENLDINDKKTACKIFVKCEMVLDNWDLYESAVEEKYRKKRQVIDEAMEKSLKFL